jgi:CysZ protein
MTNPVSGVGYFINGLKLIIKPGVKRYVIIPLLINTVLFLLALTYAFTEIGTFTDWLMSFLPEWLSFLQYILLPLFWLAAIVIVLFVFSMLINIIGAPFNPYIAKAVEHVLTGSPPPEHIIPMWAEAKNAVLSEIRKWIYFIAWSIPVIIITFIPGINFLSPFAWFIFGAWMYSLEYADYPLGNRGMTFPDIKRTISKKRFVSLGFGSAVTVGLMIPFLNFIIMPISVAGATEMTLKEFPATPAENS